MFSRYLFIFKNRKTSGNCLKIETNSSRKESWRLNKNMQHFVNNVGTCVSIMGLFSSTLMSRARVNCVANIVFLKSQMKWSMDANECRLCVYLFRPKEIAYSIHVMKVSSLFCAYTFNEFPDESCALDFLY